MTGSKLTALTETTTPTNTDYIYVVVDPASSAASKYATLDNIFKRGVGAFSNFTANDATPSVATGTNFKTNNTSSTTITAFDDGQNGMEILVVINDANTTIDFSGTTLKGNGGVDWGPSQHDFMRCTFDGTNWYCEVHKSATSKIQFTELAAEPGDKADGMLAYADGTNWDPGRGEGLYIYENGAWLRVANVSLPA